MVSFLAALSFAWTVTACSDDESKAPEQAPDVEVVPNLPVPTNDLIKFQKIVKVSSKYESAYHNGKRMTEKCFRVFASSSWNDGYIGKRKAGGNIEKFANTPERCFIENGDINEVKTDKRLNKQWYIDLTKKRLEQFGGADRGFI